MTERLRQRALALPLWQRSNALEPTPGARVLSALVVTAAIATLPKDQRRVSPSFAPDWVNG